MAGSTVNKIFNANIYMDGSSYLGKASSIEPPAVEFEMVEHDGLGLIGKPEFFAGIQAMEATIMWNSFYPEVMKVASNPTKAINIQIRANLEQHTSGGRDAELPLVISMTGIFKNLPNGNFKQHENAEFESKMSVNYIKATLNGEDIYEIDVIANIYKIDGTDILGGLRANLGV